MASGVALSNQCLDIYSDLQLRKKYWYIIYKLTDDLKEIVVDSVKERVKGDNLDAKVVFEELAQKLIAAENTVNEAGKKGEGRYAVLDVHYETEGSRTLDKVVYLTWVPDTLPVKQKMLYASSNKALRGKLTGIHVEIQCNDSSELKFDEIIETCRKKSRD